MSKARVSPHFRFYGTQISIRGSGKENAEPSEEALRMIAVVEEYVKHDRDGMLCTVIHEEGIVCRMIEGHK